MRSRRRGEKRLPRQKQGVVARAATAIREDVTAAHERDPAAAGVGWIEILLTYGGVQARLMHRIAHALHERGVPLLPRLLAHVARTITGVEIHPAARIGHSLFIDHGAGVVVGETAEIGDRVTIYQGVTLGGTGFSKGKRHPTVGNEVVIGSGAKLLGPITVGDRSKIGANSVVIHDVPRGATVVGNPGHPVRVDGRRPTGPDADWAHLPDPVADAIRTLAIRMSEIERRTAELVGKQLQEPEAEGAYAQVLSFQRRMGPHSAGG
jgi:serine O-acetyltransferase